MLRRSNESVPLHRLCWLHCFEMERIGNWQESNPAGHPWWPQRAGLVQWNHPTTRIRNSSSVAEDPTFGKGNTQVVLHGISKSAVQLNMVVRF